MKRGIIVVLTIFFVMLMAVPAFGQAQLDFNGKSYDSGSIFIQDGVSFSSAGAIADALGCDLVVEGNNITLQENDNILHLVLGSKAALLDDVQKQMPAAPILIENEVFVPIRFVYESFGATVSWNDLEKKIVVNYTETRGGMSAEDLMLEASEKMIESNSVRMVMDMDMDMDMTMSGQSDGEAAEELQMATSTNAECWIQYDPLMMYMVQNVEIPSGEEIPAQTVQSEMVISDNAMYMNMPEMGWVKMDIPGIDIQELINQSMSMDPAANLKMWSDMGIIASFANNDQINGQEYWIVNYTMGKDILESDYFKQIVQSMGNLGTQGLDMQSLFDNMDFDLAYSIWVNPNTLQTDYMSIAGTIDMNIDMSSQGELGNMSMNMSMEGTYTMSDYGVGFELPDVSGAIDYNTLLTQM